jgi:hypothetical protein
VVNEGAEPKMVTLMDNWTSFLRVGTALGIAWADAVDPADKAGYAYGLTDAPPGLVPTRPHELAPGASITITRFLAVGHSPVEALGLVAAQRGPTGQVSGTVHDTQADRFRRRKSSSARPAISTRTSASCIPMRTAISRVHFQKENIA